MGSFSVPLLLAIMSVFNPYPQPDLRFCLHIFTYHISPSDGYMTTSLFSLFKGLGMNLNNNCKADTRKSRLWLKLEVLRHLISITSCQELHWIQFFKDSSFTTENSKNVLATKQHSLPLWSLPRISQYFLVSNAVMQHLLACLCKVKRISQGGFLDYDIPNRL